MRFDENFNVSLSLNPKREMIKVMKKYLLVSLLALLAFVGKAQEDNSDIVKVGRAQSELQSHSYLVCRLLLEKKKILVNFFATWCPPCQKELAAVQQTLCPKYKNNKDFVLLVIGREHSDADLQKYNEKKGFDFPLYPDKDRAIFGAFAKNLIPRGYLVGKDGKIIYTSKGYTDEEFAELMTKIEGALK